MKMKLQFLAAALAVSALALMTTGCRKPETPSVASGQQNTKAASAEYVFALIAKNQGDPVFESARVGAEDAARAIGDKLGVKIKVLWQTPNEQDTQKQVEYIDQLVLQG